MPKLIIRVEKNIAMIDDMFKNAKIGEKILLQLYKQRLNGLYLMMRARLSSYRLEEEDNSFISVDEGTSGEMENAKRKFENFMFSDENKLKDDAAYKKYQSEGRLRSIVRRISSKGSFLRDKAIAKALGGTDVLSFFTRVGIIITWRIEDDPI